MAQNRLFVRVLSSGMQAGAVQVLGGVFYYLISVYLSKNDFGIIGWLSALCLLITTLLGFGLEQVVIRRVAASSRSDWAAMAFLAHSAVGFIITFLLLLALKGQPGVYHYLPWFFAAQGLTYLGVPLKQFLNAKELFTPYAIISLVSNAGKIIAFYGLLFANKLNLHNIIALFIAFAAFELFCLLAYVSIKTTISFKLHFRAYIKLIKEAAPQYLSVIFDISLSRMDWILLGFLASNVVLADYSFAYRAFELARLPMLVVGPIILPRLARSMAAGYLTKESEDHINSFATVEMFLAALVPLTVNILWTPLVTFFTHGKYGEANAMQFLLLSFCVPIQLFINLLWSISFSAKKYKQVTTITIVCALLNIVLNLILIPLYGGLGAAIAFLLTTILQGALYYNLVRKTITLTSVLPALMFMILATVIYLIVSRINVHYLFQLLIATTAYLITGILSRKVNKQQFANFKQFLTR